ncbi:unnamed protein product [Prorocentrum cordatum]|uniref:Uncharacterized protein n=1 Tax=Prorocentrum cordatum TaxID=2364126 RepID=A0ABN9PQB6_9DINO|nr:unnamed protein product [Polarella glacialis]
MQGGYQGQQMAYAGQMLAYQQDHQLSETETRKFERREMRLKMMEKKAKQEVGHDETVVKGIVVLALFNAALLFICLCGGSWKFRAFRGFGMKTLSLQTSLLSINVEFECGKNWVEDKVCKFFQGLNGHHSLMEFSHLSCVMGETPCQTMKTLYYGNFIIFLTVSTAIILQLGGAGFIWFYWYKAPLAKVREWALNMMTVGPLLAVTGIGSWAFCTPDLGDLPRGWAALMSSYTGNSLLSYHPLNNLEFGWTFFLAIITVLFMFAQVAVFPCCFRAHWREQITEQELEEEELRIEESLDASLLPGEAAAENGSAWPAAGAPSQYGALPQQPPGYHQATSYFYVGK